MKITKERLIEIIKEELEAIQEDDYGRKLVGREFVPSKKRKELIDDLKNMENPVGKKVAERLPQLYQMGVKLEKIHAMAKKKDLEGLKGVLAQAKNYGDRVSRSLGR